MENISFVDFQKMDIRVAQIKVAEEIVGADKLYRLIVDLGTEERELVAGIKQYYPKEELIGKKIIMLANLEPRVIRGVTSHGMVLCGHTEDRGMLCVTTIEKDLPNGSKVS